MSWIVDNNPALVAVTEQVYVLRVDLDRLPDEIEYERIVGERFAQLSNIAGLFSESVILLTSKTGFVALRDIADTAHLVGPKGVADLVTKQIAGRHAVVMRWQS